MTKINRQEIKAQKQEVRQSKKLPTVSGQASQSQVTTAQQNILRTKEQINTYNQNLITEGFLDIDGDGRTTNYDGDLINAYANGEKALKQYANPKAPEGNTGGDLSDKIKNLIDTKKLDSNGDGKVSDTELHSMRGLIANSQTGRMQSEISNLIESGAADIDGNGQTNETDIKLMNAYFKEGKLGADLVKIAPGADPENMKTKLLALRDNPSFDSNVNNVNKKRGADLAKLTTAIRANMQSDKIDNLIDNNRIDVDGDGVVTVKDADLLKSFNTGNKKNLTKVMSQSAHNYNSIKEMMKNMDVNGDGKVTNSDFDSIKARMKANEMGDA